MEDFIDIVVSIGVLIFGGLLSYLASDRKKKQEARKKTKSTQSPKGLQTLFDFLDKENQTQKKETFTDAEVVRDLTSEIPVVENNIVKNQEDISGYENTEEESVLDFDLKQAIFYETILHAPYIGR